MSVKVSIIINCHNGAEYLKETLDSLKEQTFDDYEVIFWDNQSDDNSKDIALKFDKRLKYYYSEEFTTLGEARNNALKNTSGEYVAFIDCDDIWMPNKLEKQVKILDEDKDCGMVFSNFIVHNMMNNTQHPNDVNTKDGLLTFNEMVGKYAFCLSSFLLRKSVLARLDHAFNTEFKYAEEFELFSRIAYYHDSYYFTEPLVKYRVHKSMNTIYLQDRIFIEYEEALNNLYKIDKDLDKKYPEVVKKIQFIINFNKAKYIIKDGQNGEVRNLMKPFVFYNYRAFIFWCISCLPQNITVKLANTFYKSRI